MRLRRFKHSDAARVADLVGDKDVSDWTSNIPYPYSKSDAESWISATSKNSNRFPFAVENSGEIVACVSYWPHSESATEVGYWVGKDYWGKGIATSALKMLLSSDQFPKTDRVVAKIMYGNSRSEGVLINCGFTLLEKCVIDSKGCKVEGKLYQKKICR